MPNEPTVAVLFTLGELDALCSAVAYIPDGEGEECEEQLKARFGRAMGKIDDARELAWKREDEPVMVDE